MAFLSTYLCIHLKFTLNIVCIAHLTPPLVCPPNIVFFCSIHSCGQARIFEVSTRCLNIADSCDVRVNFVV